MIPLFETKEFKGMIGGWYKMRAEPADDKIFYAQKDVTFSLGDSADSAIGLSATVSIAAIVAALTF